MQVFSSSEGLECLVVLLIPRYGPGASPGFCCDLEVLGIVGPGTSHRCLIRCRFRVHLDSLDVVLKARYPACVAALDRRSWAGGLQALLSS
jgi:hypothetical protein